MASTEASTSATPSEVTIDASTSAGSQPSESASTRIVASMLLSRPPRQMQPLSRLEVEYYRYARQVTQAISANFNPDFYFRKGSQGEQAYKELVCTSQRPNATVRCWWTEAVSQQTRVKGKSWKVSHRRTRLKTLLRTETCTTWSAKPRAHYISWQRRIAKTTPGSSVSMTLGWKRSFAYRLHSSARRSRGQ